MNESSKVSGRFFLQQSPDDASRNATAQRRVCILLRRLHLFRCTTNTVERTGYIISVAGCTVQIMHNHVWLETTSLCMVVSSPRGLSSAAVVQF
jgi:hypothetical protein